MPFRRIQYLTAISGSTIDLVPLSFADAFNFIYRPNFNSLLTERIGECAVDRGGRACAQKNRPRTSAGGSGGH